MPLWIPCLLLLLQSCALTSRIGIVPPDRAGGPEAGDMAPDFRLHDLNGRSWQLSDVLRRKPVVLVLGSYSCPAFRGWAPGLEALREEHQHEVEILVLYTVEAHPTGSPSPYRPEDEEWLTNVNRRADVRVRQPENYAQRHDLATKCRATLELKPPILIDTIDNRTWKDYGEAPNAAYLIGTDGRVILRLGWFHSGKLSSAIERHVGQSLAAQLQEEGAKSFVRSWNDPMERIESKSETLATAR